MGIETTPVWTVGENRKPQPGAEVVSFRLRAGIEIPALLVGEEGRGRELGVLPVEGAQPGERIAAGRPGLGGSSFWLSRSPRTGTT